MFGFYYGSGGLQKHHQSNGCGGSQGRGISPETHRNDAAPLIQPRCHAFPYLGGDGLFRAL